MKKRQFGNKTLVYASDQNVAQDYVGSNIEEIISDGKIYGIISGGSVLRNAYIKYTVTVQSLVARTSTGQRIAIDSTENIFIKPLFNPGTGKEVWVTAYAVFVDKEDEIDVDGDGNIYHKDYKNSYQIKTIQGVVTSTGHAVRPTVPINSILICDILYNSALYVSGWVQQDNVDITRQKFYSDIDFDDLIVTKTSEFGGEATFRGGVDMQGGSLRVEDATPTTGASVLNRDQNDDRYVNLSGDVMTGDLSVQGAVVVSGELTGKTLIASGIGVQENLKANTLSITGDLVAPSLSVDENISADTLNTSGGAVVSGYLSVTGSVDIANTANIGSSGKSHSIDGSVLTSTGASASGEASVSGNVSVDGSVVVGGTTTINGDLVNVGDLSISGGAVDIKQDLSIDGYIITSGGRVYSGGINITWKTSTGYIVNDIVSTDILSYSYPTGWFISGNMAIGTAAGGGAGVYDAALAFAGDQGLASIFDYTQEFNGSTWSLLPQTLNEARVSFGFAGDTKNSAMAFCGIHDIGGEGVPLATTEVWNGSTWSVSSSLPAPGFAMFGCGPVSNALAVGGVYAIESSSGYYTLSFNGTTWSVLTNPSNPRLEGAALGSASSSVIFKGGINLTEPSLGTELFNGSSWSAGNDVNVAAIGPSKAGTPSAGLVMNGATNIFDPPECISVVEEYNGTTWSVSPYSSNSLRWVPAATGTSSQGANWGGDELGGTVPLTELLGVGAPLISTSTGFYKCKLDHISSVFLTDLPTNWDPFISTSISVPTSTGLNDIVSFITSTGDSLGDSGYVNSSFSPESYGVTGGNNHDHISGGGVSITEAAFGLSDVSGVDAWTTSTNLNSGVENHAAAGTQSSALSFGGDNTSTVVAITEKFNGSAWTTDAGWNLNYGRMHLAGCGTQSAALSFGGAYSGSYRAVTEKFDGSTWTTNGGWDLLTARGFLGGAGVQNAAISCAGHTNMVFTDLTEIFDGSSWSSASSMSILRVAVACSGSAIATLCFGGSVASSNNTELTEKFNGSVWSITGDLNTARRSLAGAGTQNSALSFGGYGGGTVVEKFSGNNWYIATSMNISMTFTAGCGAQLLAACFGGAYAIRTTQLFVGATSCDVSTSAHGFLPKLPSRKPSDTYFRGLGTWLETHSLITSSGLLVYGGNPAEITIDYFAISKSILAQCSARLAIDPQIELNTWSSSTSLNVAKTLTSGCGGQNSGLNIGGYDGRPWSGSSYLDVTERFNGAVWASGPGLATARGYSASCGVQNGALNFGGSVGSTSAITELGTSYAWSATGSLNTARVGLGGCGTINAATSFGGNSGSISAVTEKFNGSTWASSGNLTTARQYIAGAGSSGACISFGGDTGSVSAVSERFNGLVWTAALALNVARSSLGGSGTLNAALSFSGTIGSYVLSTEKYNGFSWITTGDVLVGRGIPGSSGTQNAALFMGGSTGSASALVEKFIGRVSFTLVVRALSSSSFTPYTFGLFSTKGNSMDFSVQTPAQLVASVELDTSLNKEDFYALQEIGRNKVAEGSWTVSATYGTPILGHSLAGVQSAAVGFGGMLVTGNETADSYLFNGSSWSVTGSMNIARVLLAGSGLAGAALSFGGSISSSYTLATERFNGSSWSVSGDMANGRFGHFGVGNVNATRCFGGYRDPGSYIFVVDVYNGSTWSSTSTAIIGARLSNSGAGGYNTSLCFGGSNGASLGTTEKCMGYAWATMNNFNVARYGLGGAGVQTTALNFGGYTTTVTGYAERFNGLYWTLTNSLNVDSYYLAGCGAQNSVLSCGGSGDSLAGPMSAITEKYVKNLGYRSVTFAFTATGDLNVARAFFVGVGHQNVALAAGGYNTSTEKFNGTSWSTASDFLTPIIAPAGAGNISAALHFGGGLGGSTVLANCYSFNYNVWSVENSMNTARSSLAGAGIRSAAISFGGWTKYGYGSGAQATTETFNGTSWTASGNLNTARWQHGGSGTRLLALCFGGYNGSALTSTEKFIGSAWSAVSGTLTVGRNTTSGCGGQNSTLCVGGLNSSSLYLDSTEKYNGVTWIASETATLARKCAGVAGSQNRSLLFGGYAESGATSYSEKYTSSYVGAYVADNVIGAKIDLMGRMNLYEY